jgi:hypothetical protein
MNKPITKRSIFSSASFNTRAAASAESVDEAVWEAAAVWVALEVLGASAVAVEKVVLAVWGDAADGDVSDKTTTRMAERILA